MIPILLLGAAALAAGAVIVTFWDEIKQAIKLAWSKVQKIIKAAIVGFTTYIKEGDWRKGAIAAFKFYSKDERGQWSETVATKTISEHEVPPEIRAKLERSQGESIDISKEMEMVLS